MIEKKRSVYLTVALGLSLILTAAGSSALASIRPVKVHLKLAGGWSFIPNGGGDLELVRTGSTGYSEQSYHEDKNSFDWKGISRVPDWKAEVLLTFGRYFGASLGLARTALSTAGNFSSGFDYYKLSWSQLSVTEENSYRQEFRVSSYALQLNVYGFLPLGRFNAYVFAGPGYYFGNFSHEFSCDLYRNVNERGFTPPWLSIHDNTAHEEISEKAQDRSLGFQGGIGLEFRVLPFVSLGFEALIRRVNLNNWEGTSTRSGWSINKTYDDTTGWDTVEDSWTLTGEGPLWYCYLDLPHDLKIKTLYVGQDPPEGYFFDPTRKAEINFHGVDFLLTLKFHF